MATKRTRIQWKQSHRIRGDVGWYREKRVSWRGSFNQFCSMDRFRSVTLNRQYEYSPNIRRLILAALRHITETREYPETYVEVCKHGFRVFDKDGVDVLSIGKMDGTSELFAFNSMLLEQLFTVPSKSVYFDKSESMFVVFSKSRRHAEITIMLGLSGDLPKWYKPVVAISA